MYFRKKAANLPLIIIVFLTSCVSSNSIETATLPTTPPPPPISPTPEPETVSLKPVYSTEYIANPGMGWQRDFSTYSELLPETVVYANRTDITWKILNPGENLYEWSILDKLIEDAEKDGKLFSFRVFTMAGEEYGGHQIPEWVINMGADIFSNGEPDYSNCVYQEKWGGFVNALLERYDGNPSIAYIDISGYGNFNEWGWSDIQTEWDDLWDERYSIGMADRSSFIYLDSQARRRLADMFIGGSFSSHQCRGENGSIKYVDYSYNGAQETQLIMPYAGIGQSTEYVYQMRKDVGFRYDCLGRVGTELPEEAYEIWRTAPVIYEFCGPGGFDIQDANRLIQETHPTLMHNNDYNGSPDALQDLLLPIGYRFFMKEGSADFSVLKGGTFLINMTWQNFGTAPAYPKMGMDYDLRIAFLDPVTKQMVFDYPTQTNVTDWLPAQSGESVPEYVLEIEIPVPASVPEGYYVVAVSIVNKESGLPIQLAMEGSYVDGRFELFEVHVK